MSVDRHSATAMHLRGIIEKLIDDKRRSLERLTYGWEETQALRGELKAYRRILKEVSIQPPDNEEADESD